MADTTERIVEARLKLRERWMKRLLWFKKIMTSPSGADSPPQGSGPANRHGMPKLPVGQTATTKWPVLDLGIQPDVPLSEWRLVIDGAVEEPVTLDWAAFQALPQVEDQSDFHCVTTWSLMDSTWGGVRLSDALAVAIPKPEATHLMTYGSDGYSTNFPLEEGLKDDVLLVHSWNGQPLPREHGGPVRVITPQLYAWKGAKWVNRVEVLTEDRKGFWEVRGYSNSAHPWRDDRYS